MTVSAPIPGGIKDRLLPVSIPFRFFLAAVAFHLLAWLLLSFGAADLSGFTGGTGPVLGAIHLLTLGVFSTTAIGASYQLLPVATRQPLTRTLPARASFWLLVTGIPLLAYAMATSARTGLVAGAVLTSTGLVVFAVLTALNLRSATSLPVVAAFGWGAILALAGLVTAGLYLIADFNGGFLANHSALAHIHMVLAVFGFMGLLVAGFSTILIPMFALSTSPKPRPSWALLTLAGAAIVTFTIGAFAQSQLTLILAAGFGLGAGGTYLWLMQKSLRARMRRKLGLSFLLIRASWGLLAVGLIIGFALLAGVPIHNGDSLFGFVILAGWLLTFLLGILQRIMPFLASMHITDTNGRPVLLSKLTARRPLQIHAFCHFAALLLIAAGIVLDLPIIIRTGAGIGVIGAVSFAVFAGLIVGNFGPANRRG